VHLDDAVLSEQDVDAISGMSRLEILSIQRTRVPRSLRPSLTKLAHLTWLVLDSVDVPDECTADISRMRQLRRLYLNNCGLSDDGLSRLRLPELAILGLARSHVSATGLQALKGCPKLETLELPSCDLSDASLKALAACTAISNLDVSDNPITDRGLEILSRMPNLGFIQLNRTKISDAGLFAFAQQPIEGRHLEVRGTAVTKAGIAELLAANPLMVIEEGVTLP
jgi:Ran GTPase-activating protein (RanGAP) involved in mRNA processing and transport